MRLFGFNITRRTAPDETPISQLSPDALAWLSGAESTQTAATLSNAYQQVPWVYRAVNALAEQVANIPFLFSAGERGRENLITSGPLIDFYAHPHPQINRFQYWELRVIWLLLRGECFRIPIYEDPSGRASLSPGPVSPDDCRRFPLSPSEGERAGVRGAVRDSRSPRSTLHAPRRLKSVLILDPSRFQHIVQDGQLLGWRYTGFSPQSPLESQVFLPEEVWFEKLPNPFDFWRAMSPLAVAALATSTDFSSAAFMQGIIDNNADAGLIVRSDQQLDDAQREQIRATITNRKRRAGTADRPIILWGVNEIVKPTLSSADSQFLENRKFTRGEICAAFGVPEEIVTTTSNSKYDVMSGARLNFIENRVAPLCRRLEAEEEATVKAIDPNVTGWFDLEALPIMQEALRKRLASAKIGFDMGIPFNELNRVFDLGFKPFPWGDTAYLPSKYQPLTQNSPGGATDNSLGQRSAATAALGTPTKTNIPLSPSEGERAGVRGFSDRP